MESHRLRAVDLFSGCGGLSLGFSEEGFDIAAAFDNWDAAIECYRLNFDHPVLKRDLSDPSVCDEISAFGPDIIIGGPPCQDFSSAGRRVESERANLTVCYSHIISVVAPDYFLMENVSRARNSDAYKKAREMFKSAGYGLTERVLDASLCGVPQKRMRFVCIGCKGAEDGFLDPYIDRSLASKPMTVRDYFGNSLGIECYYRHPRSYVRRGIFSIDEPAPTVRGVNRPMPAGYPGHKNDACPSDKGVRALTTLERSMIQTFPSNYRWIGTKTDMEQMIGNAVPVKLGSFLARCLKEYDSYMHL